MEQVTVLPPGEWDPKIRLEPPNSVPSQDFRKAPPTKNIDGSDNGDDESDGGHGMDPALESSKM